MLKDLALHLLKYVTSSVAAVGVGTLAVMGTSFFVARWNRQHAVSQSESKDRRETAYAGLRAAVDHFSRQTTGDSPLKMRNDWAHLAHALEASRTLAAGIRMDSQLAIWRTQFGLCRRITASALITQEAFLCVLKEDASVLAQFNHTPAEKHVAVVLRWALELAAVGETDKLEPAELQGIRERGLPLLVDELLRWRAA